MVRACRCAARCRWSAADCGYGEGAAVAVVAVVGGAAVAVAVVVAGCGGDGAHWTGFAWSCFHHGRHRRRHQTSERTTATVSCTGWTARTLCPRRPSHFRHSACSLFPPHRPCSRWHPATILPPALAAGQAATMVVPLVSSSSPG